MVMGLGYKRPAIVDYLCMTAGTCLMGIAIQSIYDPVGMVVGGFTGVAILIRQLTVKWIPGGIPLWFTNLALNLPVFLCAWRRKGKKFLWRALYGMVMLSFWLLVLPHWNIAQDDYMLAAIYGGCISGAGIGLVLVTKSSTGGTDMVATLLQRFLKQYTIAQIMLVLDGIIVLSGMFFFGVKPALYAVVAIFITTEVADAIMEGIKYSKAAYIITEDAAEVADALMHRMNRGVTAIHAKGMYSGNEKDILFCAVSKKEIVELKEIVMELDSKAFVIVTDAREVLGEGFLEY